MKLFTIRNIFFTKYILSDEPKLLDIEAKLKRFKITSTEIVDDTTIKYDTYRSGMVTVTISEAMEVSYRKAQMSLLTILGGLHTINERKFSEQNHEFVNKYRQRYFSIVEKLFKPVFEEKAKRRHCKWLVRRLNRIDPNYRWHLAAPADYHLNGKIYQVAH